MFGLRTTISMGRRNKIVHFFQQTLENLLLRPLNNKTRTQKNFTSRKNPVL